MIFEPPTNPNDLAAWAKRITEELNRFHPTPDRWPEFADDAAAAAANLPIGAPYVTPAGAMRRRAA